MDDYQYFYNKSKKRINGFLVFAIVLIVVAFAVAIYNEGFDHYDNANPLLIIGMSVAGILIYKLVFSILLAIAAKSETATIIVILLSFPTGLFFFWPMIRYHRGDEASDDEDNKVFKATVKAYQKAWGRQCFFQRVIKPLFLIGLIVGIVFGYDYLQMNNPKLLSWIGFGVLAVLFLITLYASGGVQDVRRTYDYYEGSVGTGIFDYGVVTWNKTKSVTKDETDISLGSVILSIALLPLELLLIVIAVLVFTAIQALRIVLPIGGKRTIFLHKSSIRIHPNYMPFADTFLSSVILTINRALGLVFGFNFVNKDFWFEGIGPQYICENLSRFNLRYLERMLEKIENKYGYYYNF